MKKTITSHSGSSDKKDATPNKAVRQFRGSGTKSQGPDLTKFDEWYDLETLHFFTLTAKPNLLAFRYIFIAETGFQVNFVDQFKVINTLRKQFQKVAYFISYEPAEMITSHFIFGIIIEKSLVIINPLGTYKKEGYLKIIPDAIENQSIEKIYYCTTTLQRDPGQKLVSCGPLCASLMNHISTISPSKIVDHLNQKSKHIESCIYHIQLEDELVPPELKPLINLNDEVVYKAELTSLRATHLQQLTTLTLEDENRIYFSDEQHLMLQIIQNSYNIKTDLSEYTTLKIMADFFEAIFRGDKNQVNTCLARNPAVLNQMNLQGYSALNLATLKADTVMVQHLLDKGVTLDIGGPRHHNAEDYAQFCGQAQIVQLIESKRKQKQTTPPTLTTYSPISADPSPLALKPSAAVVSVVVEPKKKDKKKTTIPSSSIMGTPSSFFESKPLPPHLPVATASKQKGGRQLPICKLGVNRLFRLDEIQFRTHLTQIKYLQELIRNFSTTKEPKAQAGHLIKFYITLMNIPYKYGRSNIEKSPNGKWEDASYLLKVGLPTLVKELTVHKVSPETLLSKELIHELCTELPIVLANFEKFQLQETVLDQNGSLRPGHTILQDEITQLKNQIARLEATRYTEAQKAQLKQKIADSHFACQQIEKIIVFFKRYKPETDVPLSPSTLRQLEVLISRLDRITESAENIAEGLKRIATQSVQAEEKRTLNRLIKEINITIPDCNTLKSEITELLEYNRLLLQLTDKTPQEKQLFLVQKKLELETLTVQLGVDKELLGIANAKSSQQIKKEMGECRIQLDTIARDIKASEQAIADANNSILQIEKQHAASANMPYEEWKPLESKYSKLKQEGNRLSKNREANREALEKLIAEMEPIKRQLTNYVNDNHIKMLRNEIDNHSNTIQVLTKKQTNFLEQLEQLEQELKKAIVAEDSYNERDKLTTLLSRKEQKLSEITHANADLTHVKFTQLKQYQINYSKRRIKELLKCFQRNLFCAHSNIAIISTIVDFVAWQKEYCDEEMRRRIELLLPENYLKDFRGFRNKGMHSLDDISRLEFAMAETTAPNLLRAKNLLFSILSYLLIPKHIEFLEGKVFSQSITLEEYPVTLTIPPFSVDTCLKPLPGKQLEDGTDTVFSSEEQVAILKSAIANSKAILFTFTRELGKDKLIKREGTNNEVYSLAAIVKIMCTDDKELNDEDIGIKLKYDALLQALGQAMGNLQQYSILSDFGKIDIEAAGKIIELNEAVPLIKDYRSTRTHNGFYNPDILSNALEIIGTASQTLVSDLEFLYNAVKNAYQKTEPLQLIEFDSIYSESGNLKQIHCKLS